MVRVLTRGILVTLTLGGLAGLAGFVLGARLRLRRLLVRLVGGGLVAGLDVVRVTDRLADLLETGARETCFASGFAWCTFALCGSWRAGLDDPLLASATPASATQAATTSNTPITRRDFIYAPPFESLSPEAPESRLTGLP